MGELVHNGHRSKEEFASHLNQVFQVEQERWSKYELTHGPRTETPEELRERSSWIEAHKAL